ncbi:hypothetical protein [Deinococcus fonticola]|uniref:hypothetical protein n=1 Tax=Deinococcus fonticola TaxID=2528713 RepID=UPI00107582FD|nr:hypothetical protein [Deinococcus fonticola]
MTTQTAENMTAADALRIKNLILSLPAQDPQRKQVENKVMEAAESRMDADAREIYRLLQTIDCARAVRVGLMVLQGVDA